MKDEKEYGRADKLDGNNPLYKVHHLTHSGRKNKVKVVADGEWMKGGIHTTNQRSKCCVVDMVLL